MDFHKHWSSGIDAVQYLELYHAGGYDRKRLEGTQHWDQYGKANVELCVPGLGRTYLHILCWYCFYNDGQYRSWKAFRSHCGQKKLDVDHGDQGCWRVGEKGVWKSCLNVHMLTLESQHGNRRQGGPLRQKYSLAQERLKRARSSS